MEVSELSSVISNPNMKDADTKGDTHAILMCP